MKIKKGQTRIVFVFSKVVIKIPNFLNGYKFVLMGLLANLTEKQWKGFSKKLCPVMFTFPLGIFSIMKTAIPIDESYIIPKDYFKGLPLDNSVENFGIVDDILVLVDYGEWIMESMFCPNCNKFFNE